MIRISDVEVRVFGGNLEWFDGMKWRTLGAVAEYVSRDPLSGYTGRQSEVPEEENAVGTWGGPFAGGPGNRSGEGSGASAVYSQTVHASAQRVGSAQRAGPGAQRVGSAQRAGPSTQRVGSAQRAGPGPGDTAFQ